MQINCFKFNFSNNASGLHFKGFEKELQNDSKGKPEYSQDIFVKREKDAQTLKFLDYLLENETDISPIEHGKRTGKILTETELIFKNTIKKVKK